MTSLVIKTGMTVEQAIARRYAAPGTLVLTGEYTADALDKAAPKDCRAILSFGVCGGLSPKAQIGQAFIYRTVVTPTTTYYADPAWRRRIFAATRYWECPCWSTGDFNTANTITQRADLYAKSHCDVIDDESFAVAEVARRRNIAFIGLRTVSDGAEDNLPPAVLNALNPDGTDNLLDVMESVATDPAQIPALIKTAVEAKRSLDELDTAAIAVGRQFQWV